MEADILKLNNGIKAAHYFSEKSKAGHLAVFIRCGTRDESRRINGMAHFIEHTLFKGTHLKSSNYILNRIDSVGGELNAYTTKEETCLYASFPAAHNEKAFELLGDILANSVFPEKELKKEKAVILDEINLYKDTPSELIYDEFEDYLFKHHPLGKNILGTEESLKRISRKDVVDFFTKHYHAKNFIISYYGPETKEAFLNDCNKYFKIAVKRGTNRRPVHKRKLKPFNKEIRKNIHQVHCVLGNTAYSLDHKRRIALTLLNNILGGPSMNSRLNMNIRERYGYTYQIDSNYTAYEDTGIFSIYFATDLKQYKKTLALVHKELDKICAKKLTTAQLNKAKEQMIGQISLSYESPLNMALGAGKSLLSLNEVLTFEEIVIEINKIKAEDLFFVAKDIMSKNKLSQLTFLPK